MQVDDLKRLGKDLSRIIGSDYVFTDRPTNVIYARDVMPYELEEHNIPCAVVRPASSEDISGILKYANREHIPVHVHGSGTSMVGQARPKIKGIVLDTSRMIDFKVFPERGYFEVGAGAHLANVRKELSKHNAMLPIFPGSELVATVGGSIAVNSSAHAVDAVLGKPGDYVLGLEAVLPTGEIIQTGTESTRKPAGIEATKFLVGSEGLLCVITKVRMRLLPMPHFTYLFAFYPKCEDILGRVMEMYKQAVAPPLFFEYLDETSAKIGFELAGLSVPSGPVAMMCMHSLSAAGSREKADHLLALLKEGDPIEASIVEDPQQADKIWSTRSRANNYVYRNGTTFGSEVTPRVDKLIDAFRDLKELVLNLKSRSNAQFISFGHIGGPSIHGYAFWPTKDIPNAEKKALTFEMWEKTEEINVKYGGCGSEWGLTGGRVSFLKKRYNQAYFQMLLNLKKALDPNNILNRGNLEEWT